jgi:hypothetical protein
MMTTVVGTGDRMQIKFRTLSDVLKARYSPKRVKTAIETGDEYRGMSWDESEWAVDEDTIPKPSGTPCRYCLALNCAGGIFGSQTCVTKLTRLFARMEAIHNGKLLKIKLKRP